MLRRSAFLAFLVVFVPQVRGAELIGKVIKVSDGDTITVMDAGNKQHKIRLDGIDAPESKQAFGQRTKQALSTKIFGQTITIAWEKPDKFGRKLGHVYLGARWINRGLVAEGWAWHYKQFSSDKRLADAEIEARRSNKGLWADKASQAPWDYRAVGNSKG